MLRWLVPLVLIAGCRQILGLDPAQLSPDDATIDDTVVHDEAPADADHTARKKQITVDPSLAAAGLTNFPLWISITDPDLAARARTDGSDIHFRTLAGTLLPYEIQRWNSQLGQLDAWVLVDLSTPLTFAIQYGESTSSQVDPTPDSTRVFQNYAAVWHLDDSLATSTITDASGQLNATATNLSATNRAAGKLGSGIQLGSITQRIQFTNPLLGGTSHTISAWIKLDPVMTYDPVVVVGDPSINHSRWLHARYAGNHVGFGMYANDYQTSIVLGEATWILLHWVYDNMGRTSHLYVNGVETATYDHNNGISTSGSVGYMGYAPEQWGPGLNTQTGMDGTLDEVRLATSARSASWINAEFKTQSEPALSVTLGPEAVP